MSAISSSPIAWAFFSLQCGTVYRTVGATNFAGCVAQNFQAFGPYNASTTNRRRRRAAVDTGIYLVGQARLFHTTSCGKAGDKGKYGSGLSISSCVKRRLAYCNAIANNYQWTPLPNNFGLYIYDLISLIFTRVTLTSLFSLPIVAETALAGNTEFALPFQTQQYLRKKMPDPFPCERQLSLLILSIQSLGANTLVRCP